MKKIFGSVAAVIGFAAIASFVLFVEMSPSTLNVASLFAPLAPQASPNLTADIGSIFSDGTPAAEDNPSQQATPDVASVDQNMATQAPPASNEPVPSTTSSTPTSTLTSSFAAATPTTSIIAPSTDLPESTTPDLPEATATISVTPTAPQPIRTSPPPINVATDTTVALPYNETDFSDDTNWQTTWGLLQITDSGYLELSAASNSTGGTAYLKDAQGWTAYSMDSVVDLEGGRSFALIADYADASDYVACEYTKTGANIFTVQLAQYTHGYRTPLTYAMPVASTMAAADLYVGIQVQGIYGSCAFDGEIVTNQGMGPGRTPMVNSWSGGIGFSVNDPLVGTSRLVVKSVGIK
jgi:hypothetical protein